MKKLLLMCFMLVIAFTMVGCNNETEKVKLYYSNSNMNKSLKIVSDTNSDNTIKIPELVENDTNSDKTIKIPELVADSNNIVNNRLIIYKK